MSTPYCIWSFCLLVSLGKLCSALFKVTQLELVFKVSLASVSYTTCMGLVDQLCIHYMAMHAAGSLLIFKCGCI